MMQTWKRFLATPVLTLLATAGCSDSPIDTVVTVDPGVAVGGLTFTLTGATLTAVSAALPTPDALLAAPLVAVDRVPTATQSATIAVSSAEPFSTVVIQSVGSATYLRVFLPAQTTLIGIARDDRSTKVRGEALFWLAHKAGQQAVATIANAIDNDPDTEVKKKAVFALSQLPKDEGVPKLMEVARNNRNPEVRKQAMFWLGQTHDPRAVKFFEDILLKK